VIYGGLFLAAPLIFTKGWATVRQPAFLIPLLVAIIALTLRTLFRPTAVITLIVLVYLHWRFNLSDVGIRSSSWGGDLVAILSFGLIYLVPIPLQGRPISFALGEAMLASLDRLFLNPASTTEHLFYFGFLAERLSHKFGKWFTPFLIAAMYTTHEMINPEYWYEGVSFPLIFIGVVLTTAIYLWRRSIVVVWLGDGLGRFVSRLISQ